MQVIYIGKKILKNIRWKLLQKLPHSKSCDTQSYVFEGTLGKQPSIQRDDQRQLPFVRPFPSQDQRPVQPEVL